MITYAKISPKMVNPRDFAREQEEEEVIYNVIFFFQNQYGYIMHVTSVLLQWCLVLKAQSDGTVWLYNACY